MAEIVLLANSRKLSHRCLAGIDISTGKWVRPVSAFADKIVTWDMRNIDGEEPDLLDVLNIPLSSEETDDESQPENRLVDGIDKWGRLVSDAYKWTRVGRVTPREVMKYLEKQSPLFYNKSYYVTSGKILRTPREYRKSLMLIECADLKSYQTTNIKGEPRARAEFSFDGAQYNLPVTDYKWEQNVINGQPMPEKCLLTVSIGGKFGWQHYKLAAGVIEI